MERERVDLSERELRALLTQAGEPGWRVESWTVLGGRRQLRKQIGFYRVTYRDGDQGPASKDVVLKLYGSDRGPAGHDALRRLRAAGFCPPSSSLVPRGFAYVPEHGALVQELATGVPWADSLAAPPAQRRDAAHGAASWLLALQASGAPAVAADGATERARLDRYARELAAAHPDRAGALRALHDRIVARLRAAPAAPVPSHGDYHPKNVLLDGARTSVIDFDTFAAREPGFDVGYALAQLLIISRLRHGRLAPGMDAASAFWSRYREDGAATWDRVAVHAARAFLQSLHYELCVYRNGHVELLDEWPRVAHDWLASRGAETLAGALRGR